MYPVSIPSLNSSHEAGKEQLIDPLSLANVIQYQSTSLHGTQSHVIEHRSLSSKDQTSMSFDNNDFQRHNSNVNLRRRKSKKATSELNRNFSTGSKTSSFSYKVSRKKPLHNYEPSWRKHSKKPTTYPNFSSKEQLYRVIERLNLNDRQLAILSPHEFNTAPACILQYETEKVYKAIVQPNPKLRKRVKQLSFDKKQVSVLSVDSHTANLEKYQQILNYPSPQTSESEEMIYSPGIPKASSFIDPALITPPPSPEPAVTPRRRLLKQVPHSHFWIQNEDSFEVFQARLFRLHATSTLQLLSYIDQNPEVTFHFSTFFQDVILPDRLYQFPGKHLKEFVVLSGREAVDQYSKLRILLTIYLRRVSAGRICLGLLNQLRNNSEEEIDPSLLQNLVARVRPIYGDKVLNDLGIKLNHNSS
ncbi:BA75_03206T0 [Komagataella pastoris]|uniref:BA75_03206T0 n=1 Tax=Komagataella pastoris TaxID=4922 RepID=A0A1B2JB66_PICPA|nr:BA75_03206T0 [Komagataella pastoris]